MADGLLLQCDRVVAGYQGPVVGPVSFDVHRGEAVGLLGSNGSGKSTILKAITGAARVFGGRVQKTSGIQLAHHRQQPVRPQELPLTGHDLVKLTGASRTSAPAGTHNLLAGRMDRLSGGQFQIVQIWACLGGSADVVLLDEPTNNLDPATMEMLVSLIREGLEGRALVVVSHEASFIDAVCSRVVKVSP